MKYVALLRGINVGGKNKIDMKILVSVMERHGFENVSTYINSGNVFLSSPDSAGQITNRIEELILRDFGLNITVLLRDKPNIDKVAAAIPKSWSNDNKMKCDVMFLRDRFNNKAVLNRLIIKPEIDNVTYIEGAVVWKVNRADAAKSGMIKLPGTDVYANMTIRNCNTLRKIQERL